MDPLTGSLIGGGLSLIGSLIGGGSKAKTEAVNTVAPRTPEGQAALDQFFKIYGQGGAFDPAMQAGMYAGLQGNIYNAAPTSLNMPGGSSIPIMSPFLRQKLALINQTMPYSYAPWLDMTKSMELARYGALRPVTTPGSPNALAAPLGLWAGSGYPGLNYLGGGDDKNAGFINSWLGNYLGDNG